jgi:hypothetical protein
MTPPSVSFCTRWRTAASDRPTALAIAAYERRPSSCSCSMIALAMSSETGLGRCTRHPGGSRGGGHACHRVADPDGSASTPGTDSACIVCPTCGTFHHIRRATSDFGGRALRVSTEPTPPPLWEPSPMSGQRHLRNFIGGEYVDARTIPPPRSSTRRRDRSSRPPRSGQEDVDAAYAAAAAAFAGSGAPRPPASASRRC